MKIDDALNRGVRWWWFGAAGEVEVGHLNGASFARNTEVLSLNLLIKLIVMSRMFEFDDEIMWS